jgi:hypothetical protein
MEDEQKMYYNGREVIRVVNTGYYCKGCVGSIQRCSLGASNGYPDNLYYCNDGEVDYIFKFKEEAE